MIPSPKQARQIQGEGDVTEALRQRLWRAKSTVMGDLRDARGKYGIITKRAVVLGKKYDIHGLVSVHLHAVEHAASISKPVMLFILERDCFYEYDAKELLLRLDDATAEINFRGDAPFLNFYLSSAARVKPEEEAEKI